MNHKIYNTFLERKKKGIKSFAVLIDPDKLEDINLLNPLINVGIECNIDFFFVGGSLITNNNLHGVIKQIKTQSNIPVILFPGSNLHIDYSADGVLFLSLISGRNPELLIGQHVVAAPLLKKSNLEVIPTGYILISEKNTSTVAYMSNTTPIPQDKYSVASSTAIAGEMLGLKLIYLDAGSGADKPISGKMISSVSKEIHVPLIVGGGINSPEKALEAMENGADTLVVGNGIEKSLELLIEISEKVAVYNASLKVH